MLLRLQFFQRQLLAGFKRRQFVLEFFVFFVLAVLRFFVDLEEAVELHHRSGHAEPVDVVAGFGVDVDGGLVEDRGRHLRGDKALPDELVNLEFVFLQVLLDLVRMAHGRRRTNRFVRRLRFFLLLICVRRFGHVRGTVFLGHVLAHFGDRVGRDAGRIGTHVGDQADEPLFAQFNAFIQALRDHHGALHAEAKLARRILLQLAGRERRRRVAAALFFLRRADRPVGMFKRGADFLGVFAVGDFDLLFALAQEASIEGGRLRAGEVGVDGPVFFFLERLDFAFAVDDQAESDGLHASGGKAAADFVPEQRRDLIADQAIEHAARLLRVDQVAVNVARMFERGSYCLLRNFVEGDAADAGIVADVVGLCAFAPFFFFLPVSSPSSSARCAAMASPSRSGSGAR